MIKTRQIAAMLPRRFLWLAAGLLAAPALSIAQVAQPPAGSSMPSTNASSHDDSSMGGMQMPPKMNSMQNGDAAPHDEHSMPGMQMHPMMDSMQNGNAAPHGKNPMPMRMGSMQGGSAPPNARGPDYSEGVSASSEPGMDMDDAAPLGMLQFDQLEAFHDKDTNGLAWEMHGWYGSDSNKLWVRSEGERSGGHFEDADVEALWSHAVAAYWDTVLGIRLDFGDGPPRHWAAFGVQGIVPYNFDIEATGYVDPTGRTAARVRAEYDMRFTQRLILQPDLEVNAYGRSDPARRIGAGISDAQFGLRLRYEINRRVAPYIGVEWKRRFGGTADFAREDHQAVFDQQWVAGIRIWY
ncbi:Copper resistance protein B [Paraburkholderia ribeironis]|uniref:Copper resistance protein B n=1 Tax=Paraburkholderia ribeironis TaxID=1247936 RepID=A0A1N7SKH8_9BURK|nr:copper resistance protein B [Paraburkholderia ribeironis]SIT47916.1 Copper resistance protein B [Paraburkholderia ribeironis]